jgi:hypothetical protein
LALKLPPVQPRSRKAHEATAFAGEHGRSDAMLAALFRAFFEQSRDIGDVVVLQDAASSVGLDPSELGEALGAGHYTARVLEDQRIAQGSASPECPRRFCTMAEARDRGCCSAARCPMPAWKPPSSEYRGRRVSDELLH